MPPAGVRFFAPDVAYADAEVYLPALLLKHGKSILDLPAALAYLRSLVESICPEFYGLFQAESRARLRGGDEEDWPVLAAALALSCALWTEDMDFFGAGVSVWTSDRVEIYLRQCFAACPPSGL